MYHYRITRVAHTYVLLDSVGVSDSLITNIERETIGLFFRTAEPSDPDNPENPDTPGDNDDNSGEGDDNGDNTDDNGGSDAGDNPAEGEENV